MATQEVVTSGLNFSNFWLPLEQSAPLKISFFNSGPKTKLQSPFYVSELICRFDLRNSISRRLTKSFDAKPNANEETHNSWMVQQKETNKPSAFNTVTKKCIRKAIRCYSTAITIGYINHRLLHLNWSERKQMIPKS